jgi:aerobic-type carbon monoxide dehydrogenase small subunit (CoxS/CutS family)
MRVPNSVLSARLADPDHRVQPVGHRIGETLGQVQFHLQRRMQLGQRGNNRNHMAAPKVGKQAIRSTPCTSPFMEAISCWASSRLIEYAARPDQQGLARFRQRQHPRRAQEQRGVQVRLGASICRATDDGVMPRRRAAPEKLLARDIGKDAGIRQSGLPACVFLPHYGCAYFNQSTSERTASVGLLPPRSGWTPLAREAGRHASRADSTYAKSAKPLIPIRQLSSGALVVTLAATAKTTSRSTRMSISIKVNGRQHVVEVDGATPLLWVIRDVIGMTGTKFGCGIAQCGACTVHLDGQPVRSCVLPVSAVGQREVTTIEAIGQTDTGRRIQQAWLAVDVVQCGYCQSGQIMSASAAGAQSATERRRH